MGIDLDAARAARREQQKESPSVQFAGEEFLLPIELPFAVLETVSGKDEVSPSAMLEAIFGEDEWDRFVALEPSVEDINVLFEGINVEYGFNVGNSPASSDSSKTTSKRSRRTSNGSTS